MDLNELYKEHRCYLCGRCYPETVLNVEGFIHHHEKMRCLDTKDCKRAAKLRSRQNHCTTRKVPH